MGLDVKVFKNVKMTRSNEYDFIANVIDENWNDRIRNLKKGCRYIGNRIKDVEISYPCSYHNLFRDELCRILGFKEDWRESILPNKTPFYEFFEFADNDGCIDWETSEDLWRDFKNYMSIILKTFESAELKKTYMDWLKIFEIAKNENSVIVYS